MKNLGPISLIQLRSIGIKNISDLKRMGALDAFKSMEDAGFHPTQNMLYALIGAIENKDWREVKNQLKIGNHKNTQIKPEIFQE